MPDTSGKKKTGRPPFEPTAKHREQVEALTGLMVPQASVARFLDIDVKTLKRYFRDELDHGREHTVGKLKAIIYAAARQGSIRAATYLLDRMGVWPEPENGAAAPHELKIHVIGGLAAATSGPPPHASSSHPPRTRRDEI
jgi:hypothetical protein